MAGRPTAKSPLEWDGVTADDLREIRELLAEVAGDSVDLESAKEESVGRTSASLQLMRHDWRLPKGTSREQYEALVAAHLREAMLERWPRLALGVLGGKSPSQVAGDESFRRKLLAAVLVLQSWVDPVETPFDFNELRSQLGLPTLDPIDPGVTDLRSVPPVRLSRVMVERASDEALCDGFFVATFHGAEEARAKFAREIVARESLAGGEVSITAYRILAEAERDSDKALDYVERGRVANAGGGAVVRPMGPDGAVAPHCPPRGGPDIAASGTPSEPPHRRAGRGRGDHAIPVEHRRGSPGRHARWAAAAWRRPRRCRGRGGGITEWHMDPRQPAAGRREEDLDARLTDIAPWKPGSNQEAQSNVEQQGSLCC